MGNRIPLLVRYERHIRRDPGGCWVWTKNVASSGYPQLRVGRPGNGPVLSVHRWAYEHFVGPIPDGMLVLHHCDNKRCSRPDHLYCGTQADNMKDMDERGRRVSRGGRPPKLDDEQVVKVLDDPRPAHEIAAEFGVSEATVYRIKAMKHS